MPKRLCDLLAAKPGADPVSRMVADRLRLPAANHAEGDGRWDPLVDRFIFPGDDGAR